MLRTAVDQTLPLPSHVAVGDGDWVLAMFELDAARRATAAAGRGAKLGDSPALVFERRDWDRLIEFAHPVAFDESAPETLRESVMPNFPVPSIDDGITEVRQPIDLPEARIPALGILRSMAALRESRPKVEVLSGQTAAYESASAMLARGAGPATLRGTRAASSEDDPPLRPSLTTAAARVYVIDPDEDLREIVGELLDAVGLQPRLFATGEDALATLDFDLPSLVMLERTLPGIGGLEVCAALRRHPRTATVPILFLTSLVGTQQVVEGFAAGADDYVVKPFRATELGARLFGLLRRSRLQSPTK
jgi:two-component system phosphate regulon response regulator PhoB